MNENVDSLMIRLVGLALAVLMMAGMTIYTGLFPKTSAKAADTHAMWQRRTFSRTSEWFILQI